MSDRKLATPSELLDDITSGDSQRIIDAARECVARETWTVNGLVQGAFCAPANEW
jgi:hypothetical protein